MEPEPEPDQYDDDDDDDDDDLPATRPNSPPIPRRRRRRRRWRRRRCCRSENYMNGMAWMCLAYQTIPKSNTSIYFTSAQQMRVSARAKCMCFGARAQCACDCGGRMTDALSSSSKLGCPGF